MNSKPRKKEYSKRNAFLYFKGGDCSCVYEGKCLCVAFVTIFVISYLRSLMSRRCGSTAINHLPAVVGKNSRSDVYGQVIGTESFFRFFEFESGVKCHKAA